MIYGDRIRLRALEKDDLPHFVRWLNDPEVRDHLSLYHPLSQDDEERWYQRQMELDPIQRPLSIEVQADPDGKWIFIGNCGYVDLDWRNRKAELGIQIGKKEFWNRGFGTKAVQLLLKYGFQTLNLNRIWLRVQETNHRAARVYQKSGFVPEGTFRQDYYQDGSYHDMQVMSVLKADWIEHRKKEQADDA